jgi:hypothetical protein
MNTYALTTDPAVFDRLQSRGLIVGVAGLIIGGVGAALQPSQLWPSWLIGFMFCLGMTLGCLAMLMLQHMVGGLWGMSTRRIFEAGSRLVPYCILLFIPICFVLPTLYVWARPGAIAADEVLAHRGVYFHTWFFLLRAAIYFAVWWFCAYQLNRWSVQQDEGKVAQTEADTRRFRVISAPGLLIYVVFISLASIDWLMSLDAHWFSTMFGFVMVAGEGLGALSFAVAVLALLAASEPLRSFLRPVMFHDLGKLMLAFIMLWAYFSFSQFLIIWAGNLPEEIIFYLARMRYGWGYVSILLIFGHFVFPFCVLLSASLKRRPKSLARVAWYLIAVRLLDLIWIVSPAFNQGNTVGFPVSISNVFLPIGMFGIWVFLFARLLRTRPLLPANDPYFKEMLANVSGH